MSLNAFVLTVINKLILCCKSHTRRLL